MVGLFWATAPFPEPGAGPLVFLARRRRPRTGFATPETSVPETSVNVREFRQNLSGYLRQAHDGPGFVITARGQDLARVVPPASKAHHRHRLVGLLKGQIQMAPDFDQAPAELIAAMDGSGE